MLGHYRAASETPFKWRFTGGPMMARLLWYLNPLSPHQLKQEEQKRKTKNVRVELSPLWQAFWIRECSFLHFLMKISQVLTSRWFTCDIKTNRLSGWAPNLKFCRLSFIASSTSSPSYENRGLRTLKIGRRAGTRSFHPCRLIFCLAMSAAHQCSINKSNLWKCKGMLPQATQPLYAHIRGRLWGLAISYQDFHKQKQ